MGMLFNEQGDVFIALLWVLLISMHLSGILFIAYLEEKSKAKIENKPREEG
jgi:hypothetical protein